MTIEALIMLVQMESQRSHHKLTYLQHQEIIILPILQIQEAAFEAETLELVMLSPDQAVLTKVINHIDY